MAHTAKNLWPAFMERENFKRALKEASSGKRFRTEVLKYAARQEENIQATRALLQSGQWRPGHYRNFYVHEPKKRLISAPCFRDRVVHHAIVQIIEPLFERRFISHSYACRKGKGTHAASQRMTAMLREQDGQGYALKADISRYFPSINHAVLLNAIGRVIGDRRMLALIGNLVTGGELECGLPIGALTSQLFANVYLDRLDHYVKDGLGVQYYVRYMDDFIILHRDKKELWRLLGLIETFLAGELHLRLNPKTAVFSLCQGVDFVGYRHWPQSKKPRRRNVQRAKKRFAGLTRLYHRGGVDQATVRSIVASFVGYMRHCNGYRSLLSALERLVLISPADAEFHSDD
ncbi:MAG: reverse transcriptase/maturase family protein [Deltaproteobacteria bacterium]|jgi:retron-type reverse transcriptase|nr:reverse transcriptase/maturase family protein [Deltaproteobacteria bacterium]